MQRWGLQPQIQRLDNEYSKLLKEFMTANNVVYKLKRNRKYSLNYTKKPIQDWKDQFLLGMASTHPDFTLPKWWNLLNNVTSTWTSSTHPDSILTFQPMLKSLELLIIKNSIATTWHENTGPCSSHQLSLVRPAWNQAFLCRHCNGTLPLLLKINPFNWRGLYFWHYFMVPSW